MNRVSMRRPAASTIHPSRLSWLTRVTLAVTAVTGLGTPHALAAPLGPPGPATPLPRPAPPTPHPLDPLTRVEIARTAGLLRAHPDCPPGAFFPILTLSEPPKAEVIRFRPGEPFRRDAFAVVLARPQNQVFEALVDLRAGTVRAFKAIPQVQPLLLNDEFYSTIPKLVKADPSWQEALRKRGISDFDKVQIEAWAASVVPAGLEGARLVRAVCYYKDKSFNFWGRPIEGVVALVNVTAGKVIEVTDSGVVPLAPPGQELGERALGPLRRDLRPLEITQPAGRSFSIVGNEVRWQKWRFRFALHPREGLVLYTVAYEDQGRLRSILYRASVSEMVVPYGDPDGTWSWKSAFDIGEYGLGKMATSLEPRRDAPANAVFADAELSDETGKPYTVKRAITLYERDGGILWKHYDDYDNQNETRRSRELVIGFVAAVGNYDYGLNWTFRQDGSLEFSADLTGIMLPKGVKETSARTSDATAMHHGHLVAPNIVAPHHQHFFNLRLDLDIDGEKNAALEMNTHSLAAGAHNPNRNAFVMDETLLRTEGQAQRDLNLGSGRKWHIVNRAVENSLGQPAGYILVPGENAVPYALPESLVRKRAPFLDHHVWVTRYWGDEQFGAGAYPNQSRGGEGLPRFAANDESLEDQDIVLWYTMGTTHIPRPEEWPVMPTAHIGFKLIPAGFFARNPALDVPK